MSFGGYAAPFVQGSSSPRDAVRRLGVVATLLGGVATGAAILWAAAVALQRGVGLVPLDAYRTWLVAAAAVPLIAADAWAVGRARLCPLGARRQAVKALLYRGYPQSVVGFVWGFDVGLGVTTFRVTTGIWLLAVLVAFDVVAPWAVFVYAGAFCAGLLAVTVLPVSPVGDESRPDAVLRRIMGLDARRRLVQAAYLALVPVALASVLLSP